MKVNAASTIQEILMRVCCRFFVRMKTDGRIDPARKEL